MFGLLISNVLRFIVPIGMFIWAFFMPQIAGYSYVTIYALFSIYLLLIDKRKPNPDPEKWTSEEIVTIRKYHLALMYSFGAKDLSVFLNGFRLTSPLWVILFLYNQMWFAAVFLVLAFFITASISVRLDPFYFLTQAVQSGKMQFSYELSMLQQVAMKLKPQENTQSNY